jgi:hypothetical protein
MQDYDSWKSNAPEPREQCECGSDAVTRLPKWLDRDESPVCSQCLAEANPEL